MINNQQLSELTLFYQLTKATFGLDFQHKNEARLIKAIDCRMKANSINNSKQYYFKLINNEFELQEFISLLTINETYFYREAGHLKFLTDSIVPQLRVNNFSSDPIRILSIGCSTGAEPYSIAMALDQKFACAATNSFTIFGVDVDYRALEIARTASYTSMAFRALSENLKQRYFIKQPYDKQRPTSFVLKPEIQKMVSFNYMNIISEVIEPAMTKMDVIFFRNVSIYFDQETLLSIHKRLVSMLNPNGYLIVGLTESLSNNFGLLKLKNEGELFYFQKQEIKQTNTSVIKTRLNPILAHKKLSQLNTNKRALKASKINSISIQNNSAEQNNKTELNDKADDSHIENIRLLVERKNYDKALVLLENLSLLDANEKADYLLLRAFILFNRQEFDKAHQNSVQALDLNPFSVDVFLLLGMICKWQKHADKAIAWFKKALYIHSNCWPAHYYLAGLYYEQENLPKAVQEYRLVLQQLEHPQEDFLNLMTIPLSLPKTEIRLLCQSHLQKLNNQILATDMGKRYGN